MNWTDLQPFPDPRDCGFITAPFGPGLYELYDHEARKWVLVGYSKNVAYRMASLLPNPLGSGNRNNRNKQDYIYNNLRNISYRTKACRTGQQAREEQQMLLRSGRRYEYT